MGTLPNPTVRFTRRERLVLSLLCQGLNDKEIAAELEVSAKTGTAVIRRLYRKAGVLDDRQLVIYTMQQPASLRRGADCHPGLHPANPGACPCPYCAALLAA